MTDQPTTHFKYGYPVTDVQAHSDGDAYVTIDVVNFDAEDKLKEILAEFHGVDTASVNVQRIDIEDIHNQPSSAMNFEVTENNIEELVEMLIDAETVSEEEADDIEPAEVKERIAGLAPEDRNKIFEALDIKNGKIMTIDWEEKPDRFHEKGQLIVGLKEKDTQDLINMINNGGLNPDGTPVVETNEDQLNLF